MMNMNQSSAALARTNLGSSTKKILALLLAAVLFLSVGVAGLVVGRAASQIADGTYTKTGDVKGYYSSPATIPATVTATVSNGKFTSLTVSTNSTQSRDQYQIEGNFNTLKNALIDKAATTDAINAVPYSSNVSPNYPNETTFNNLKDLLLQAVASEGEEPSGSDAGKTISPGGSATIYVGETLTLQGTKPSSYGNYHYWYTDEEDVDYIEWDIDNSASSYYYAGTNIAHITGVAAGTVTVYHQYVSGGSWVDPGETFTITVKEKETTKPSSFSVAPDRVTLNKGSTQTATVTLADCTITNTTSSDSSVATAVINGSTITINGLKSGSATITIIGKGNEGFSDPESKTIKVTVTEPSYPTFTINYNSNGGTPGTTTTDTYTATSTSTTTHSFTIPENAAPTRDGYIFKGWATSENAKEPMYQAKSSVSVSNNESPKTLYAIWEKAPLNHQKYISKETGEDKYALHLTVTAQDEVVTTTSGGGTTTASTPYDIVLVLDTTFSMNSSYGNTTRLAALKEAANELINGLPENGSAKLSIINFEAYGTSYGTPDYNDAQKSETYPLSSTGKNNAKNYINNLTPTGNSNQHYGFTYPDKGMEAAQNVVKDWASDKNPKYVVFFTDGEPSDNASAVNTINIAKTLKDQGVKVYSVGILSDGYGGYVSDTGTAPSGTASISFNGATNTTDAHKFLHATSSNFPGATASGSTITYGEGKDDGYYMIGKDTASLTDAFKGISTTVTQETVTTETRVPTKDVIIKDKLSDYVELDGTESNITVAASDGSTVTYTPTVNGKDITVKINGDLKNGITYTVNIPVKPSDAAYTQYKDSGYPNQGSENSGTSSAGQQGFYSNTNDANVSLTYTLNDETKTVQYEEKPVVQVTPKAADKYSYELKFDANDGTGALPATQTATTEEQAHNFSITTEEPTKEHYSFEGWATTANASEPEFKPGSTITLTNTTPDSTTSQTLYAVWKFVPQTDLILHKTSHAMFALSALCVAAAAALFAVEHYRRKRFEE